MLNDVSGIRYLILLLCSIVSLILGATLLGLHFQNDRLEAEAVKVVENSFRDINIAFVNELAMSFEKLGIDVVNVIKGASTKPFSFLAHFPGCGVGGHCIPVDPYYLIEYGKQNGFNHEFLSTARRINNRMPVFTARLVERILRDLGVPLSYSTVAVLGLAYKPDVDDTRESPSFDIINALKRKIRNEYAKMTPATIIIHLITT